MEVRMIRELIKSAVNLLKPSSSSSRVISNQSISSSKEYEYTKPGRKSIVLDREKAKLPYSTLSSPLICLVLCKFGKIFVVGKIIGQNFYIENFSISNYFMKDILNFSFQLIRYRII